MARPWISTNLAISADGKITSTHRRPSGWTTPEDHARLLELRKTAHALLIGRATLETDRMTLTVPGNARQPLRCVVSSAGRIPPEHPLFHTPGGPIHLLTTESPHRTDLPATLHTGTLADFLHRLATEYSVEILHCEGGGTLIRALAELDAIDEFHLTLAGHTLFSGHDAPTATGIPADFLPSSRAFQLTAFAPRPESGECYLSYRRTESQCE